MCKSIHIGTKKELKNVNMNTNTRAIKISQYVFCVVDKSAIRTAVCRQAKFSIPTDPKRTHTHVDNKT